VAGELHGIFQKFELNLPGGGEEVWPAGEEAICCFAAESSEARGRPFVPAVATGAVVGTIRPIGGKELFGLSDISCIPRVMIEVLRGGAWGALAALRASARNCGVARKAIAIAARVTERAGIAGFCGRRQGVSCEQVFGAGRVWRPRAIAGLARQICDGMERLGFELRSLRWAQMLSSCGRSIP